MKTTYWQISLVLLATSAIISNGNRAIAQIIPDSTLGAENSVVTPNIDIKGITSDRIDGGAIRGANLFHSFQEFNVGQGRGAYFSNPTGVDNIFSRVTGSNASNIYGKLGVLGNSNLFLLNPNGILFGPNASLDLGGSFLGSTGNRFNFGNGQEFSASNPTGAPLLSVSVPLGVQFNQEQPQAIANSANLSVATGQNLTLLGGTVASTGQLSAPGGQIAVAAVPSSSVVNVSSSGQLLNIDTSSTGIGEGSSLADLLLKGDAQFHPGLTVNSQGQVEVAGSNLSVRDGDVVAKSVVAQTATLTAHNDLTLVESLIGANEDLNLLAGDTVRIRDSAANPFVAQAGGRLLVQGRQGVDIFALNHPNSGLVSGGDLILRSANTVGGDAHYWTGGNFRIEQMDGSLGGLFSPYDPVIRAVGDVSFESYRGNSLHILAGGSVNITGNITITGREIPNNVNNYIFETIDINTPLLNGENLQFSVSIDGSREPTLDIRAGIDRQGQLLENRLNDGSAPSPLPNPPFVSPLQPFANITPQTANITIGGNISNRSEADLNEGQIFLTNQYRPNSLSGSITVGEILTSGDVTIHSRGNITTTGTIATNVSNNAPVNSTSGSINLIANGNIRTGNLSAFVPFNFSGQANGGNITLISQQGIIDTTQGEEPQTRGVSSATPEGNSGNIFLQARGNITIGRIASRITPPDSSGERENNQGNAGDINIISDVGDINTIGGEITSSSISDEPRNSIPNDPGYSTIRIESLQGTIRLNNGFKLSTNNRGTNFAGDIFINAAQEINITGQRDNDIATNGYFGRISINSGNRIVIKNSEFSAQTPNNLLRPRQGISPRAGDITITSRSGNIEIKNSILTTSTSSRFAYAGNITLTANRGNLLIRNNSDIRSRIFTESASTEVPNNFIFTPTITLEGNSVQITDADGSENVSQVSASTNSSSGRAGDVIVIGDSLVLLRGNGKRERPTGLLAQAIGENNRGIAGNLRITTDELRVENGGTATVSSRAGQAGNIEVFANRIFLDNGNLSAVTGGGSGANIFLLGKVTTGQEQDNLIDRITQINRQISQGQQITSENLPGTPLNFLIIGNGSQISANANNLATGGNININARLLLALPPTGLQSSDITANAVGGRGGQVNITANPLGIYGIQFREIGTNQNDITASSQTGAAGVVSINQPDTDPSRGLIELPEDLGDSSKLIAQSCPVGGQRATSQFVVSGRGGLPPNPGAALSGDVLVGNGVANTTAQSPTDSSQRATVEAQGVNIGSKGEIILTANPSKLSSYSSWQKFVGCNGK